MGNANRHMDGFLGIMYICLLEGFAQILLFKYLDSLGAKARQKEAATSVSRESKFNES